MKQQHVFTTRIQKQLNWISLGFWLTKHHLSISVYSLVSKILKQ